MAGLGDSKLLLDSAPFYGEDGNTEDGSSTYSCQGVRTAYRSPSIDDAYLTVENISEPECESRSSCIDDNHDDDETIRKTKLKQPKQEIKTKVIEPEQNRSYDALIVCDKQDENDAKKFRDRICREMRLYGKEEPRVELLEDTIPIGSTWIAGLESAIKRETYNVILVFVTKKFCEGKDNSLPGFSSQVLQTIDIKKGNQSFVPFFTEPKDYEIPATIDILKGIDACKGDTFLRDLCNMFQRKREERKAKSKPAKLETLV